MDARHILLIHPLGYDKRAAARDISRMANLMPPLGLASIAAYLEQYGFRVDIVDCFAHPDADQVIEDYVRRYRPGFVGATCTTAGFLDATCIFRRIKELSPETFCLAGGPHVSALRERIIRDYREVDYVVVGEGETPLRSLMEAGGDPQGIAGLVYRDDGRVVFSGLQKDLLDLDTLPLPAYHRLEGFPRQYQLPIFNYPRTPNTSCISSRGCPYQCSYCDRSVFRRTFRYNSADYLYRHVQTLRTQFGIRHINFYDDQFTFHRERVVAFCRRMIEEPLGMTFNCAVRAEHVDPELLVLMKDAGCWMISLGIETGDPDLLAQHRQNADLDWMSRTIRAIHKAGIRVKGLFMIGLPGETEQSFRRTMDYVFSLPIDDLNVAKFTPFPGSPLYENIHSLGRFEENWEKMDCMNTVFVPHGLTAAQLESLFLEFYKRYYTRPKTLWNFVTMAWKSPDSWRRFLANAGSFLAFARANRRMVERQ
ncbi:MAG: B12-binding domain-containing radical SAM protein [Planctomycetes bacterium]|nr:B12-binding domain-containing radical SAM protein [Planctomycetota bacterium]